MLALSGAAARPLDRPPGGTADIGGIFTDGTSVYANGSIAGTAIAP